jgi:hypothetical protein
VSALSQVKCQTARVPEHVAEIEWFVTRRATKSHRAVNEFSNVATVQRLSPVGCIRPKRSAPRSDSYYCIYIIVIFHKYIQDMVVDELVHRFYQMALVLRLRVRNRSFGRGAGVVGLRP